MKHARICFDDGCDLIIKRFDLPIKNVLDGLKRSELVFFVIRKKCSPPHKVGIHFVFDLPYARRVAQLLRVKLDIVTVSARQMAADVEYMVAQLDEPLADPAALNVLYISRLARQHGLKVLLSGAGGDDLFSGYRRHVAINYDHCWDYLPQPVRSSLSRAAGFLDKRHSVTRQLGKMLSGAALTGNARLANYFVWATEAELRKLYTPNFLERLGNYQAIEPLLASLATLPDSISPLDRMLALEQQFFLPDHNLTYTDKMSMAASGEVDTVKHSPCFCEHLVIRAKPYSDFENMFPLCFRKSGQIENIGLEIVPSLCLSLVTIPGRLG